MFLKIPNRSDQAFRVHRSRLLDYKVHFFGAFRVRAGLAPRLVRDVCDNSVTVIEEGKFGAMDLVAVSKVFKK
jgi:hypothetical protein